MKTHALRNIIPAGKGIIREGRVSQREDVLALFLDFMEFPLFLLYLPENSPGLCFANAQQMIGNDLLLICESPLWCLLDYYI